MPSQHKRFHASRPCTVASARAEAQAAFDKTADFCQTFDLPFGRFENQLLLLIAALGVCLIRLFLVARRERYGISYVVVPGEAAESLAPVVERLTGT